MRNQRRIEAARGPAERWEARVGGEGREKGEREWETEGSATLVFRECKKGEREEREMDELNSL